MKDYQAYLFDWDGTLAKTVEAWIQIIGEAYKQYGVTVADDDVVRTLGNLQTVSLAVGLPPKDLDDFVALIKRVSHDKIAEAPLYPGAYEALIELKRRGKKLALITTGWRHTIEAVLEKHDLSDVFDVVVTGSDVREHMS